MLGASDPMIVKTVSRFFWKEAPPFGEWTAALIWNDTDSGLSFDAISGRIEDTADNKAHHIRGDVLAVLAALQAAKERQISSVRLLSVNDSVVRTIREYYDGWERRKWLNANRKPIDSLDEWKQIKAICDDINVDWEKRPKEAVDLVEEYQEFRDIIDDRENDFWMQRAIDRDPWG